MMWPRTLDIMKILQMNLKSLRRLLKVVFCHCGALYLKPHLTLRLLVFVGIKDTQICLVLNPFLARNVKIIVLGVSYGSYSFYEEESTATGFICFFSLKNPSYPEFVFEASSPVLCLDIHPTSSELVVAGLRNGNLAVYDVTREGNGPKYTSIVREILDSEIFII